MSTAFPSHMPGSICWRRIEPVVNLPSAESRFLLWVDAVGGFLVCRGDRVRLGQAVPENPIEVPFLADLSRHHATIRRDNGDYLIEPLRDAKIDGARIERPTWLVDGNTIELGRSLRLSFRRPHPLSATARLDIVSHHRTQPAVSGILLMADSCVLGPGSKSHIVCRHWTREAVICKQRGELLVRSEGPFEISGVRTQDRGKLASHAYVTGEQFSFSVEELG